MLIILLFGSRSRSGEKRPLENGAVSSEPGTGEGCAIVDKGKSGGIIG